MLVNLYYCVNIILKKLIFRLIKTYFGNTQNVSDLIILSTFSGGPRRTNVNPHHCRVTYMPGM